MKKRKSRILVLFLAVLLVSVMSCENPFLKKMLVEEEKGKTVPEKPQAPFVEGGASLILSPDKLNIQGSNLGRFRRSCRRLYRNGAYKRRPNRAARKRHCCYPQRQDH